MRRTLLAVALAASLTPTSSSGFFHPLWSFLSSLWTAPASQGAGCGWDPSGRCAPALQPESEIGCGMDPSGLCHPGS